MKKIVTVILILWTSILYSQEFFDFQSEDSASELSVIYKKFHNQYDFIIVNYHKYHKTDKIKYKLICYKDDKPIKRIAKYKVKRDKLRGRRKIIWWWKKQRYFDLTTDIKDQGLLNLKNLDLNTFSRTNEDGTVNAIRLFNRETYYFEVIYGNKYKLIYSYEPHEFAKIFRERKELRIFLECLDIFDKYWRM